jgi:DNA repair exonuclease SbcCD nuclease subunit
MRAVRLIHSSDVHVEDAGPHAPPRRGPAGIEGLSAVLRTARALNADLVLLAGDTFDHARIGGAMLARATALIAEADLPVVLLPGNHDAALPDCLFRRAGLLDLPQVSVLGVTMDAVLFEALDLEIWGRAHRGSNALQPLGPPPPRRTRWQVAMAHGHYVPPEEWRWHTHRAWRIADEALREAQADYVALGHWDRAVRVGPPEVQAHYSGSPDLAGTVHLVTLAPEGVSVQREGLCIAEGGCA